MSHALNLHEEITPPSRFDDINQRNYCRLSYDDWVTLNAGDRVHVQRRKEKGSLGSVDDVAEDASYFWVWLDEGRGRVLISEGDGAIVSIPTPALKKQISEVLQVAPGRECKVPEDSPRRTPHGSSCSPWGLGSAFCEYDFGATVSRTGSNWCPAVQKKVTPGGPDWSMAPDGVR